MDKKTGLIGCGYPYSHIAIVAVFLWDPIQIIP